MPVTYDAIASTTLSSATANITFNSISASYTDLRVVVTGTSNTSTTIVVNMRFNSDSGSNYRDNGILFNQSGFFSSGGNTRGQIPLGYSAFLQAYRNSILVDIFSYTNTINRALLIQDAMEHNESTQYKSIEAVQWNNATAINSITVLNTSGFQFGVGTNVTLYGILRA